MALISKSRRVGVVGMYSAGKSVFLTSMINHVLRHDPKRLPLGDGTVTLHHLRNENPGTELPEFPYDRCRVQLHGGKWPAKTRETTAFRTILQPRKQGAGWLENKIANKTEFDLSFIDIPGERLADMGMAGKTYEQWSDDLLAFLEETREYQEPCDEYMRQVLVGRPLVEREVIDLYKFTLARLVHLFLPVISPSSFMVGANRQVKFDPKGDARPEASGSYPSEDLFHPRDTGKLAASRVVGLDAGRQFVPLSAAARQANPQLAAAFKSRYAAYAQHVAVPLATYFKECDALVILMDVTMLLLSGVGMYNGNRQMIRLLLSYVNPGHTTAQRVADVFMGLVSGGRWGLGNVSKIAFVASKADRVHESDRSKLDALLRDMSAVLVDPFERNKHIDVGYFVCSAVESSKSHEYPKIEGRFLDATGRFSKARGLVTTTPVPERWPDTWKPGDFSYPENAPDTPDNEQAPPHHIGLDRLLTFVLGLQ